MLLSQPLSSALVLCWSSLEERAPASSPYHSIVALPQCLSNSIRHRKLRAPAVPLLSGSFSPFSTYSVDGAAPGLGLLVDTWTTSSLCSVHSSSHSLPLSSLVLPILPDVCYPPTCTPSAFSAPIDTPLLRACHLRCTRPLHAIRCQLSGLSAQPSSSSVLSSQHLAQRQTAQTTRALLPDQHHLRGFSCPTSAKSPWIALDRPQPVARCIILVSAVHSALRTRHTTPSCRLCRT